MPFSFIAPIGQNRYLLSSAFLKAYALRQLHPMAYWRASGMDMIARQSRKEALSAYEERNRGDSSCSLKKEVRKKGNEPEEGLFSV